MAKLAIEGTHSLDEFEVIRRGLVLKIVDPIEAEGLCYARAGSSAQNATPDRGQAIVADSA